MQNKERVFELLIQSSISTDKVCKQLYPVEFCSMIHFIYLTIENLLYKKLLISNCAVFDVLCHITILIFDFMTAM